MKMKNKRRKNWKLWFDTYQLAGRLILAPEDLTKGQRERLEVLLLDVLSEPERFTAKLVRDLTRLAIEP